MLEKKNTSNSQNVKQTYSHLPGHPIQREALTFGAVFTRYAITAGITSQVDSPAPGPADLVALGILAVGLVHAGATVLMSKPGNVADTGIMDEVRALIEAAKAATICAALQLLMDAARLAGDKKKMQRIKKTQKANGCRHSRHS